MKMIKHGFYRHFKGSYCEVLANVKHTETEEDLVVYMPLLLNKNFNIWARPLRMWTESVEHEGKIVPRFEEVTCSETIENLKTRLEEQG